ncbi:nucleoside triphosphate pyrophosphohydrolase [Sinanaerobacter sp. ZZT-01]|uniref:nucleoside triphosphate pyrophosphohydrolase n=1 Tax=Sinanaerobacter sp. ZZT-01 TaxID=3111540 RepID=UPI002D79F351|nr:nucleoside triphosphate pyrophosphohydrolase [Sinanaerobacter sp. ZZT-01]WRR92223.1 nucleoside triphosphate pyrophosphohydrolase [Sinanaerobacter sp. ZZT-01]
MYEELYEPAKTAEEAVGRLKKIIQILRGEGGCPWDRVQTHATLRRCLIEEAYEVVEAIDKQDFDNLEEELGDVLLQVIMHSVIGEEKGSFLLVNIANRECEKMIRRHPHVFHKKNAVFSNNHAESIDKVLEKWENVKRKEHGVVSHTESMRNIPKVLPALLRSEKIQKKAAEVGFDWDQVEEAFAKVKEETLELLEIYEGIDKNRIKEEVGDLLFAVVNVSRFLGIDPEDALNGTSQKFIERFEFIESTAEAQGRSLEEMTLQEMDKLWNEAKLK